MRRDQRIQRARRTARLHRQKITEIMQISCQPDHSIKPWTPEEREILGVNDTIKLIDRIQKELGEEFVQRKMTPPEHVTITNQEAS